jgi:hypothetical protein
MFTAVPTSPLAETSTTRDVEISREKVPVSDRFAATPHPWTIDLAVEMASRVVPDRRGRVVPCGDQERALGRGRPDVTHDGHVRGCFTDWPRAHWLLRERDYAHGEIERRRDGMPPERRQRDTGCGTDYAGSIADPQALCSVFVEHERIAGAGRRIPFRQEALG